MYAIAAGQRTILCKYRPSTNMIHDPLSRSGWETNHLDKLARRQAKSDGCDV